MSSLRIAPQRSIGSPQVSNDEQLNVTVPSYPLLHGSSGVVFGAVRLTLYDPLGSSNTWPRHIVCSAPHASSPLLSYGTHSPALPTFPSPSRLVESSPGSPGRSPVRRFLRPAWPHRSGPDTCSRGTAPSLRLALSPRAYRTGRTLRTTRPTADTRGFAGLADRSGTAASSRSFLRPAATRPQRRTAFRLPRSESENLPQKPSVALHVPSCWH